MLSNEGKNLAKRAEAAHETGDYSLAIEFYKKAEKKFREASEISTDSYETNRLRYLANDYRLKALQLENEYGATESRIEPKKKETPAFDIAGLLNGTGVSEQVFEAVIKIAMEISSEGREGRAIGTAFILGDAANVMAKSKQLILNPFQGYKKEERNITDPEIRDNIKEFAQLDGVFVISGDGVVEAAGRYITMDTGLVKIPRGLGTRHSSVAAMTSATKSIGIVVSQSGGVIRIFRDGKIAATLKP
ncbi:DisA bacterial checkpoint controller nucleotide-binding protein [uncultured archaeon]|nr:DisA bacterial checkpoint controller nucleotide-binding protein [uncultured archaeon]